MDRSDPYPPCHGPLYDAMPELKAQAWASLAKNQTRIEHVHATVASLVEAHPEVLQQLVTVVYHVGEGRFTDDADDYQDVEQTFPAVAPLVAAVRADAAAAHERLYTHLAAQKGDRGL